MTKGTTFDTTKRRLQEILEEVQNGSTQLPDFQRGWVWDDDRITSLIASVSMGFPIGALMTLGTGGEGVRFKPRPVEGTDKRLLEIDPETLVLDGQQRLTSLYQALVGPGATNTKDSKNKKIRRWYYIDMEQAVNPNGDREEAVFSVPEDRIVKKFGGEPELDVSSVEMEFERHLFPVNKVFDSKGWRRDYNDFWDRDREKIDLYDEFDEKVIERFEQYLVPVIKLTKSTPKEAVCLVFEKVNTGGVSLTVFELLTATFAADNFQLRDDWRRREENLKRAHAVLQGLQSDDFLQCISLLVTNERREEALSLGKPPHEVPGISCKRKDILKLTVEEYKEWADQVTEGFRRAARFLHQQKIFKAKDVPYRTQIVPLATILTALGRDWEDERNRKRIARWFWCGVFGEVYGGAIESRFARDYPEVVAMIREGGPEPITVTDANFAPNRLLTMRTRNSAAYKGLYALLMRDGCRDFRSGEGVEAQGFFDEKMDIHHIFPRKWCDRESKKPDDYNSIINKTALSARTNRSIGGRAPSKYISSLEKNAGVSTAEMDAILASHRIDSDCIRDDDFEGFFQRRADALLDRIEEAMGKPIARDPEVFQEVEDYEEEEPEWDENGAMDSHYVAT